MLTKLFINLAERGKDASGFWGINQNNIIYHKLPIPSTIMTKSLMWKKVKDFNPYLLLLHTRQASVGDPQINKNNHPFVNYNKTLALVHNGIVYEQRLEKTFSECDSELLLRIIENSSNVLEGIKKVFSLDVHMAVALAKKKKLYLFRNKYRTLWIADLLDKLGQFFFFSTPSLWEYDGKVTKIPAEEIWVFGKKFTRIKVVDYKVITILDKNEEVIKLF